MRDSKQELETCTYRNTNIWHVRQPPGSRLCGQACVAMVIGRDLPLGVEVVGHSHGTKPKELARGVGLLGWHCSGRRTRYTARLPRRAFLSVSARGSRKSYHWILLWDDYVYDPCLAVPMSVGEYLDTLSGPTGLDLTSFMEIL
jgi:hypothetical protein